MNNIILLVILKEFGPRIRTVISSLLRLKTRPLDEWYAFISYIRIYEMLKNKLILLKIKTIRLWNVLSVSFNTARREQGKVELKNRDFYHYQEYKKFFFTVFDGQTFFFHKNFLWNIFFQNWTTCIDEIVK